MLRLRVVYPDAGCAQVWAIFTTTPLDPGETVLGIFNMVLAC